eukprot:COSAG02_NODE_4725_length_5049_cov_8.780202_7_plen_260_part_00
MTVFRQEESDAHISTILLRGGTKNGLDDLQRSIGTLLPNCIGICMSCVSSCQRAQCHSLPCPRLPRLPRHCAAAHLLFVADGLHARRPVENSVNCVKMFLGDGRLCAGGGATEIELARQLYSIGESCPGMEQYAMKKFAESLEVVPRTLAENSGQLASEAISALYATHQAGETQHGVDISDGSTKDMLAAGILDVLGTKRSAVKLAADAAITVLRVDTVGSGAALELRVQVLGTFKPVPPCYFCVQIIMAKQAGGPKGG